jgi:hypothetical protein
MSHVLPQIPHYSEPASPEKRKEKEEEEEKRRVKGKRIVGKQNGTELSVSYVQKRVIASSSRAGV